MHRDDVISVTSSRSGARNFTATDDATESGAQGSKCIAELGDGGCGSASAGALARALGADGQLVVARERGDFSPMLI